MFEFLWKLYKIWEKKSKSLNVASTEEEESDVIKERFSLNVNDRYLELAQSLFYLYKKCNEDKTFSEKQKVAFNAMVAELNKIFEDTSNSVDVHFDVVILIALSYTFVGDIYIIRNMSSSAEECFLTSRKLLEGKELDPKTILIALYTYQKLSHFIYAKTNPNKSYTLLITSISLYRKYTEEENYSHPARFLDLLHLTDMLDKNSKNTKLQLDFSHILDLQQLAKLYDLCPNNRHEFVSYMHYLLKKHMEEVLLQLGHIEWSDACAYLVIYFITNNRFTEAKNHLATANTILAAYKDKIYMHGEQNASLTSEEVTSKNRYFQYVTNSLELYYGLFGVLFLRISKEMLFNENPCCRTDNLNSETLLLFDEKFEPALHLDATKLSLYITMFPDQYVDNFYDAIKVVVRANKSLSIAKTGFKETNPYWSAKAVLYMSRLYKYLPFFEQDVTKQVMWHDKRIKLLESAIKELNDSNNSSVIRLCQAFQLEIGMTYSVLLDISTETLARTGEDVVEKTIGLRVSPSKFLDSLAKYLNITLDEEGNILGKTV